MEKESPQPLILVVDDDEGLLRLIDRRLMREGLRVATATSGNEALGLLKETAPDLLLIDLKLPDMTGQQLLAGISEPPPFIVITGQGDERVAVQMMKQGAVDYLVKDTEFLDTMPSRVSRALEQVRQARRLKEAEEEVRRLEQKIIETSNQERKRIGQDLHDGLGQHLTGIQLMSEGLEESLRGAKRPEAEQAAKIAKYVREAIVQSKQLARGLSPVELEANGLMAALQDLTVGISNMYRIRCEFVCPAPVLVKNNQTATHLFRIAQEAINNAIKHGHARKIEVSLELDKEEEVKLAITSDGEKFLNLNPNGMGLRIMKHRAKSMGGEVRVEPLAEGGVRVECRVAGQS